MNLPKSLLAPIMLGACLKKQAEPVEAVPTPVEDGKIALNYPITIEDHLEARRQSDEGALDAVFNELSGSMVHDKAMDFCIRLAQAYKKTSAYPDELVLEMVNGACTKKYAEHLIDNGVGFTLVDANYVAHLQKLDEQSRQGDIPINWEVPKELVRVSVWVLPHRIKGEEHVYVTLSGPNTIIIKTNFIYPVPGWEVYGDWGEKVVHEINLSNNEQRKVQLWINDVDDMDDLRYPNLLRHTQVFHVDRSFDELLNEMVIPQVNALDNGHTEPQATP